MVPIEGFIRETWSGDVEIRHLREHWKSMLADSCCVDTAKTLVDLRHATLLFSEHELQAAIQEVGLPLLQNRAWISAIVVRRSSQLRIASKYQGFAAMFSRDTIFSQIDEAERWLLRQEHRSPLSRLPPELPGATAA
jgi:hypothetical protein